jgi:hypothetical protein
MYAKTLNCLSVCAALLAATACADSGSDALWTPTVSTLPTPAGEGSGEPYLSTSGDVLYLSWLQESPEGGHDLLMSQLGEGEWAEPVTVAHSDRFFVNWADFPSMVPDAAGNLWAHWLERGDGPGYDYGIRVVRSEDGGRSWSDPWTPHDDGTATEHGFVNILPLETGVGISWLDGRKYAPGPDGSPPTREMTIRYRTVGALDVPGPEVLLDERVCDCCQTDGALADAGPVIVYRDRTDAEIRDIYITRWTGEAWSEGSVVHADGWNIPGCPVNGPAVGARGATVAVAWFTAASDVPKVKVAFSLDGGSTFGTPVEIDGGNPAGRVDLVMQADTSVIVSWLERTGGEGAEVRVRRVEPNGSASDPVTVTVSAAGRASGFPRMVQVAGGDLVLAWTDILSDQAQVRLAHLEVSTP